MVKDCGFDSDHFIGHACLLAGLAVYSQLKNGCDRKGADGIASSHPLLVAGRTGRIGWNVERSGAQVI